MTFNGKGAISDEEVNSWEDEVSDSDDYYDEEEEEISPSK